MCTYTHTQKEMSIVFWSCFLNTHDTHKEENIYMYILFTETYKPGYKIVNVVDNVMYVVLNVLVIIELLVMVVMIHLIFVHDDEHLDLI